MFSWMIVIAAGLFSALFDIRQRRIPNLLTFPVFLSGLIWNGYQGGVGALGWALGTAALLTLPFLFLFAAGVGGAGDAKLMGALGAWLRLPHGFYLLIAVSFSGALLGLMYSAMRGKGLHTLRNFSSMAFWLPWVAMGPGRMRDRAGIWPAEKTMTRMPYGVAIFVGACLAAGGVWLWRL